MRTQVSILASVLALVLGQSELLAENVPPVPFPAEVPRADGIEPTGDQEDPNDAIRKLPRFPRGAGSTPKARKKQPLDLPVGGKGREEDEEEDASEVITFYGNEIEGDGFFFFLQFLTTAWANASVIQRETETGVSELSRHSEFSIVLWLAGNGTQVWSEVPKRGTTSNKGLARAWLREQVSQFLVIAEPCFLDAAKTTIDIANRCKKRHRRLVFLGTYFPFCFEGNSWPGFTTENIEAARDEHLAEITSHNTKSIRIDTFYSPDYDGDGNGPHLEAVAFWSQLAELNRGQYTLITDE